MYPLKVELPNGAGFACANDESEHIALTIAGYLPAFVATTKADARRIAAASSAAE